MDVQSLKSLAIIREDLVSSIPLEHQKTQKIKWTAPIEEEQNTDEDVDIIDKEGQEEHTSHVVTEEEREIIDMVQEFKYMMVEEEEARESDAIDEEDFEIEVLFDFTKIGMQDSLGQDALVNEEYNEVFIIYDVLVMIEWYVWLYDLLFVLIYHKYMFLFDLINI